MSAGAPSAVWRRLFADHPASVRESYGRHFVVAFRIGLRLLGLGVACLCHALVPGLFEDTASRGIHRLSAEMSRRLCCEPEGMGSRAEMQGRSSSPG